MSRPIEEVIFELLEGKPAGTSVSNEEVARAAVQGDESWHRLLGQVRATARGLARQEKLVITRKGKPADPDTFKGVYRLRMP